MWHRQIVGCSPKRLKVWPDPVRTSLASYNAPNLFLYLEGSSRPPGDWDPPITLNVETFKFTDPRVHHINKLQVNIILVRTLCFERMCVMLTDCYFSFAR